VKGGQEVGGPGDDVFKFQVGQSPVPVNVALLEDLLAYGGDLLVGEAAAHQLPARVIQIAEAHEPVVVKV
jgi:hypothetical protein